MVVTGQLLGYQAIADEVWGRLERAADRPDDAMRLMVLASVYPGGCPDARLMVLRGASRKCGRIWFHTDRRSVKVDQVRAQPGLCAVGYDGCEGVQLRLRGRGVVHLDDDLAGWHWTHAGDAARALYALRVAPGTPLQQPDPRSMDLNRALGADEEDAARHNFAVIEMILESIEWHQVRHGNQRRAVMHAATSWTPQPLVP